MLHTSAAAIRLEKERASHQRVFVDEAGRGSEQIISEDRRQLLETKTAAELSYTFGTESTERPLPTLCGASVPLYEALIGEEDDFLRRELIAVSQLSSI